MALTTSPKRSFSEAGLDEEEGSVPFDLHTAKTEEALSNSACPTEPTLKATKEHVDQVLKDSGTANPLLESTHVAPVHTNPASIASPTSKPTKRIKLSAAEKENIRIEKEHKEKQRAEEKARKEAERLQREQQKAQKAQEKKEREEQKQAEKEEQQKLKREKEKVKEEKKQKVEEEKQKKEEQKEKKARVRGPFRLH